VLDPLVDREEREVAGPGEPTGVVHALEIDQHLGVAVGIDEGAVDEVRTRKVEALAGNPLALVVEETLLIAFEKLRYMLVHGPGG